MRVQVGECARGALAALDIPQAGRTLYAICMHRPINRCAVVAVCAKEARSWISIDIANDYAWTGWTTASPASLGLALDYELARQRFGLRAQRSPDDPRKIWYFGLKMEQALAPVVRSGEERLSAGRTEAAAGCGRSEGRN